MIILRIGNELVFASDIVVDSLAHKASERGVDRDQFDDALLQFIFHLESCEEAVEVFDDFSTCPVCGAVATKGLMIHKDPMDLYQ